MSNSVMAHLIVSQSQNTMASHGIAASHETMVARWMMTCRGMMTSPWGTSWIPFSDTLEYLQGRALVPEHVASAPERPVIVDPIYRQPR